jgi:hypothetical protein
MFSRDLPQIRHSSGKTRLKIVEAVLLRSGRSTVGMFPMKQLEKTHLQRLQCTTTFETLQFTPVDAGRILEGMRFGELTDTDPRALEVMIALRRSMPLPDRVSLALQMAGMLLNLAETGVRRDHPAATDREVLARVAARHLDRETVIRVYGWDPETGFRSDARV